MNEISSMYGKVYTKLNPDALAFDLPLFIEKYEALCKAVIDDAILIKEKSKQVHQSYLKFQDILMRKAAFHEDDANTDQLLVFGNLSKIFGAEAFILD